jgi:hypothetical protein
MNTPTNPASVPQGTTAPFITPESVRYGVNHIKTRWAEIRQPAYETPADSFIEEAVRNIIGYALKREVASVPHVAQITPPEANRYSLWHIIDGKYRHLVRDGESMYVDGAPSLQATPPDLNAVGHGTPGILEYWYSDKYIATPPSLPASEGETPRTASAVRSCCIPIPRPLQLTSELLECENTALRGEVERLQKENENYRSNFFPETTALHAILEQAGCVSVRQKDYDTLRARVAELEKERDEACKVLTDLNLGPPGSKPISKEMRDGLNDLNEAAAEQYSKLGNLEKK